MGKNNRFITNIEILPKTDKNVNVKWKDVKEIEVYFTDDEENYIFEVKDCIKSKHGNNNLLLSYQGMEYKKYLQSGQILNGNLQNVFSYFGFKGNAIRPYRLSEDKTYWIGVLKNGTEFYFNGENSKEIMKHNWYLSNGYVVCHNSDEVSERLNRFVLGVTNIDTIVNHIGGNKMDNRCNMLSLSDCKDNMKERLPSKASSTNITGLSFRGDKYHISCRVNNYAYSYTYKSKEKALINLLIIQKHYGYRHNEKLYYMLDNIDSQYIDELIAKVDISIKKKTTNPIICKNRFELSNDGTFYWLCDKNDKRCRVSIEDISLIKQGNWKYTLNNGKEYFLGDIVYDGKRRSIFLHRFIKELIDIKYKNWVIDHLDGDGLNNIRENLAITNAEGNGLNKKGKNVFITPSGSYRCNIVTKKQKFSKYFKLYEDAVMYRDEVMKELMKNRLDFNSKQELDLYINKIKQVS